MKLDLLFGSPVKKTAHFLVFHDESEPVANKGWLLIGLLFVNQNSRKNVEDVLASHRQHEGYYGEIHFCDLPKSFGGKFGAKARVARRWMQAYQDGLCQDAFFSCLAVNRKSPRFQHRRFAQDYYAYNRFTAMAIKAGISYLLAPLGYDEISLTLISDGKDRKSQPERDVGDNFESYIPYRVELDNFLAQQNTQGAYPTVRMNPIQIFSSEQSDLLQCADLLLGATQAALAGLSKRPVKQELGRMVVSWYRDLRKSPRQQQYRMQRKFNLWGFPDESGRPFNDFSMALPECLGQASLL